MATDAHDPHGVALLPTGALVTRDGAMLCRVVYADAEMAEVVRAAVEAEHRERMERSDDG